VILPPTYRQQVGGKALAGLLPGRCPAEPLLIPRDRGYTFNQSTCKSMNGLSIKRSTQLEPKVYLLPEGIDIDSDNVTLDGRGAIIMGTDKTGQGIRVAGRKNIIIKNLNVINYYHGVSIKKSKQIEICNCTARSTAEIQSNTLFLDIWKPALDSYGGAIFLEEVADAKICENDLQHQMNGILSYQCKRLQVMNNISSYCSGFGFHLFETCDSTFAGNYADFCCRYYLRERFLSQFVANFNMRRMLAM